jgi:hypothetical protein
MSSYAAKPRAFSTVAITSVSLLVCVSVPSLAQALTDDIVWQNVSGQVHYWPMQNGQRQGGINIDVPVGREWTLAGVGDVD